MVEKRGKHWNQNKTRPTVKQPSRKCQQTSCPPNSQFESKQCELILNLSIRESERQTRANVREVHSIFISHARNRYICTESDCLFVCHSLFIFICVCLCPRSFCCLPFVSLFWQSLCALLVRSHSSGETNIVSQRT